MKRSRSTSPNRRGNILLGLMALAAVAAAALIVSGLLGFRKKNTMTEMQNAKKLLLFDSAVSTMMMGWNASVASYLIALDSAGCANARSFVRALKEGAGCKDDSGAAINVTVSVFNPFAAFDGPNTNYFSYGTPCTINNASSDCLVSPAPRRFLIGTPRLGSTDPADASLQTRGDDPAAVAQRIDGASFEFVLSDVNVDKLQAEFTVRSWKQDKSTQSLKVIVMNSLTNLAHMETSGAVVQESNDFISYCPVGAWGRHLFYDPISSRCMEFSQMAAGTGLHYFNNHYFGFRGNDSLIVDLINQGPDSDIIVNPANGRTGPVNVVHPPYSVDALVDAQDLTLIGTQIYMAKGSSGNTTLQAMNPSLDGSTRVVCDLASRGWGQAVLGLAALETSDPLIAAANDGYAAGQGRFATFLVKTDSGQFLTTLAMTLNGGTSYQCFTLSEEKMQQIEYKRTWSFDRTQNSKSYFFY